MQVSAATWNTLSKLLDEALDLEPGERVAWIEGLGTTQPELAPVLRQLLAAHASSETADLLRGLPAFAADAVSASDTTGLAVGSLVGPYQLKRELGSGGMADVWLAERADGAFERDVALKLPRISRLRRDLPARFARERDILARLEHPHVARFYDAGVTSDGLPYLAIEYVDGQPITQWCDEHRLDIAARLRLFAQVLDAVQFAHANLVIHRDLKPSNILVTEGGQVSLLDFGIAKLLSDEEMAHETRLTQFAGRVLTPDYASPEQIKGEPLTTATDVYSLGVVLYELIAGRLPYQLELQSAAQLEQAIIAADPGRPSSTVSAESAAARGASKQRLIRALKGDLDTIVLKALAKEAARRYATIAELADDLCRHLAGKTVRARPASWGYRTRKFVNRNRVAVGAATAITLALIAATGVSAWQAQVARKQALRAEEVKQFIVSIFRDADVEAGGSRTTTAVDLLKQARERLDAAPIADSAIRVELLTTIGTGLYGLGELQLSASVLDQATSLATVKLSDQDRVTAQALSAYGSVLFLLGELELAARQFEAAEARSRRAGDMVVLAAALRGKSDLRKADGQYDSAIEFASEAVRVAEQQAPPVDKRALIDAYRHLADVMDAARRKGALEPAQRAYTLARELYADHPTALLLETRSQYAQVLADEGNALGALTEMKAVLQQQTEMLGRDHVQLASTLRQMGALSMQLGDPDSSIEAFSEALRIGLANSTGKPIVSVAATRLNLGAALFNAHRYEQALAEWRGADLAFSGLLGVENNLARLARSGAALCLARLGKLDEADAIFSVLAEKPFSDAVVEAFFKSNLGLMRSAQGRHDEALALLRGKLDVLDDSPRLRALSLAELGGALAAAGRAEESLEVLRKARMLLLGVQRNGSPDLADIALNMARAHLALGSASNAVTAAGEAVAFWSRFDPNQRDTGVALLWQARALAAAGQAPQAADAMRQAAGILAPAGLPADQALLKQTQREIRVPVTAHR